MDIMEDGLNNIPGTLKEGEYHPSADSAMRYVKEYLSKDIVNAMQLKESLASCALSGNRLAEICSETLERIMTGQAVGDIYLLGLSWFLKTEMEV
jgi:hypothetical protein